MEETAPAIQVNKEATPEKLVIIRAYRNLVKAKNAIEANPCIDEEVKTAAVNALNFQLHMSTLIEYTSEYAADKKRVPVKGQHTIDTDGKSSWMA